mgnify:CR=1 FL=1
MTCFFYKSYDELLEFAKYHGIEKTPLMGASEDMEPDGIIDLSEKNIKDFTVQSLDELVPPSNPMRPNESYED